MFRAAEIAPALIFSLYRLDLETFSCRGHRLYEVAHAAAALTATARTLVVAACDQI